MGAEPGLSNWVAAGIAVVALIAGGGAVAAEAGSRSAVAALAPVTPANYRLPAQVATLSPPAQPIPFSHAHHVGTLALDCAVCHVGAGPNAAQDARSMDGAHMTLPATQVCMNCHVAIATDRPSIQLLAKYHAAGEEVPWARVYRVLTGVNWTHKAHLSAGIKCQTCHGDVGKMAVMSVATPVTAMATCLNCHRATQAISQAQSKLQTSTTMQVPAKSQCETCHSWPAADDFRRWAIGVGPPGL